MSHLLLVAAVEARSIRPAVFECHGDQLQRLVMSSADWDCSTFLGDSTGVRLVEEIGRRIRKARQELGRDIAYVGLSVPGTVDGTHTVVRSSRLNIRSPLNVSDVFAHLRLSECRVFHDTECLALGEAIRSAQNNRADSSPPSDCFAYVLVDEGVGASVFLNGEVLKGAGAAGHLGRLVVEPDGAFNPVFESKGALETFASRPWVSINIVNEYLASQGKGESATPSPFRSAVEAASTREEKNVLTVRDIAAGIKENDPIATTVLESGARYLGLGLNAIIAVLNPPLVVLGGDMITEVPGFADKAIEYARRFSWSTAWNRTEIRVATATRDVQLVGTAHMLRRELT